MEQSWHVAGLGNRVLAYVLRTGIYRLESKCAGEVIISWCCEGTERSKIVDTSRK